MKYLVMECHRSYAVVLADDGRFLTVANLQYEVGQTVSKVVEMLEEPLVIEVETKSRKLSRWVSGLAALAACMVIAIVIGVRGSRTPYGSVYMTINPEVRIDVNQRKVVVGVEGLNEDGKRLLEGYSYYKKELDPVMDELVDRAIAFGYLSDGGEITIEMDADDAEWALQAGDELRVHLDAYLMEKISVTIDLHGKIVEPEQTRPQGNRDGTQGNDVNLVETTAVGDAQTEMNVKPDQGVKEETVVKPEQTENAGNVVKPEQTENAGNVVKPERIENAETVVKPEQTENAGNVVEPEPTVNENVVEPMTKDAQTTPSGQGEKDGSGTNYGSDYGVSDYGHDQDDDDWDDDHDRDYDDDRDDGHDRDHDDWDDDHDWDDDDYGDRDYGRDQRDHGDRDGDSGYDSDDD